MLIVQVHVITLVTQLLYQVTRLLLGALAKMMQVANVQVKHISSMLHLGALLHTLDNPNAYGTSAGDQFGSSVAISGNSAIVGAHTKMMQVA